MITMTAQYSQCPLRSGKSSCQELDADGHWPSRPPAFNTPSSDAPPCPDVTLMQLAQHACELAHSHQLATGQGHDRLLARLNDNERVLQAVYHRLMLRGRATGDSARGLVVRRELQPDSRVDAIGPTGSPQGVPPRVAAAFATTPVNASPESTLWRGN